MQINVSLADGDPAAAPLDLPAEERREVDGQENEVLDDDGGREQEMVPEPAAVFGD